MLALNRADYEQFFINMQSSVAFAILAF